MTRIITILMISLLGNYIAWGQTKTRDSINNLLKKAPQFTIFQDNYFITGIPLDEPLNSNNSDAKFLNSLKDKLINRMDKIDDDY